MTWLSQIFGFFKAFQLWVTIAPWESALRVRLGKRSKVLGPGPHFRIPFLDRVFVQAVRLRTICHSGQTMTTKDGKVLTLSVAVSYSISDIQKLYESVSNPESTLLTQLQGHVAEIVANSDSEHLTPRLIQEQTLALLPSTPWGLSDMKLMVTTFAYVKCYRLLNYEFPTLSSANELEKRQDGSPA